MEYHGQSDAQAVGVPNAQTPQLRPRSAVVIRTVIVDDEPLARRGIRARLERAGGYEIVAECASGREAIAAIREHAPSVVFLDVQMPGIDGFGVIDEIGADRMPVVIFVTAYDAHALKAFEAHAFDYLLKPIDDDRFAAAVERARERVTEREESQVARRLAALMHDLRSETSAGDRPIGAAVTPSDARPALRSALHEGNRDGPERGPDSSTATPRRIIVKDRDRVIVIDVADIDWVGADGDYVRIHANGKSHLVRETMAAMEQRLDPATFVRIHRSAIVNSSRIRELKPYSSREYTVILRDGTRLRLSRRFRDRFRAHIGGDL